ncbi:hypothetical protein IEO21_03820 [Rhodonia placenta]|uniref:F-box domain-containing protein n=1 Tax=Rhodonia placenta TaxID=104341 RepID=A0A8H7P588_9APHY|nr:hypothetical protein IEO21_03820 [Postia placenta]
MTVWASCTSTGDNPHHNRRPPQLDSPPAYSYCKIHLNSILSHLLTAMSLTSFEGIDARPQIGQKIEQVEDSSTQSITSPATDSCAPGLPLELHENIIDCIRTGARWGLGEAERQTLIACALTCRSWLPRSLANLVHTIHLDERSRMIAVAALLEARPFLQPMVTNVSISNTGISGPEDSNLPPLPIFPVLFMRKMSTLQHLTISFHTFPSATTRDFYQCFAEFTSITSLNLSSVEFSSAHDFAHLILIMPNLRELTLSNVKWSNHGILPALLPPGVSRPRLAVLRNMNFLTSKASAEEFMAAALVWKDVIDLLTGHQLPLPLEDLPFFDLNFCSGGFRLVDLRTMDMGRLLRYAGADLRSLSLAIGAGDMEAMSAKDIINTENNCEWIPCLLAQIISSRLRKCMIVVNTVPSFNADVVQKTWDLFTPQICSSIDTILTHTRCSGLRQVIFVMKGISRSKTWYENGRIKHAEFERSRFPKLYDRGILSCMFFGDERHKEYLGGLRSRACACR